MYSIKIGDCYGSLDLLKQKIKEPNNWQEEQNFPHSGSKKENNTQWSGALGTAQILGWKPYEEA